MVKVIQDMPPAGGFARIAAPLRNLPVRGLNGYGVIGVFLGMFMFLLFFSACPFVECDSSCQLCCDSILVLNAIYSILVAFLTTFPHP